MQLVEFLQKRHAPLATSTRTKAIGDLARNAWLLARDEVRDLPKRHVKAQANMVVGVHRRSVRAYELERNSRRKNVGSYGSVQCRVYDRLSEVERVRRGHSTQCARSSNPHVSNIVLIPMLVPFRSDKHGHHAGQNHPNWSHA